MFFGLLKFYYIYKATDTHNWKKLWPAYPSLLWQCFLHEQHEEEDIKRGEEKGEEGRGDKEHALLALRLG